MLTCVWEVKAVCVLTPIPTGVSVTDAFEELCTADSWRLLTQWICNIHVTYLLMAFLKFEFFCPTWQSLFLPYHWSFLLYSCKNFSVSRSLSHNSCKLNVFSLKTHSKASLIYVCFNILASPTHWLITEDFVFILL